MPWAFISSAWVFINLSSYYGISWCCFIALFTIKFFLIFFLLIVLIFRIGKTILFLSCLSDHLFFLILLFIFCFRLAFHFRIFWWPKIWASTRKVVEIVFQHKSMYVQLWSCRIFLATGMSVPSCNSCNLLYIWISAY